MLSKDNDYYLNHLINIEKQFLDFAYYEDSLDYYLTMYSEFLYPSFFAQIQWLIIKGLEDIKKARVRENKTRYVHAEHSRYLLYSIEAIKQASNILKNSEFGFDFSDPSFRDLLFRIGEQLNEIGGSYVIDSEEISNMDIPYSFLLFQLNSTIQVYHSEISFNKLENIGSGSYADVYRYHDDFLDYDFAVKVLKKGSDEKSISRFNQEFDTLKRLNSPYILTVYSYLNNNQSYIMELMDGTIEKICQESISIDLRFNIARQIFEAVKYIHLSKIYHRDIAYTNFLYKKYDDGRIVVKASDFGVPKDLNNRLTSTDSTPKGHFIDNEIYTIGFKNYSFIHDLYPLAMVISFVMTGKGFGYDKCPSLLDFIKKSEAHEFKSVDDQYHYFLENFNKIKRELE